MMNIIKKLNKSFSSNKPESPENSPNSTRRSPNSPRKSPNLPQESHNSPQESPNSPQESPNSPQESPNSPQKSPNSPQKSPNPPEKSNSLEKATISPEKAPNLPEMCPNLVGKNPDPSEKLANPPELSPNSSEESPNSPHSIPINPFTVCDTCQNEGCCQICKKIPCDASIQCSAKSCQKWIHYKCSDITEQESESIKIYYCPPCRISNPMLKNISYKIKKGRPKTKKQSQAQTQKPKKKTKIAKNKKEKPVNSSKISISYDKGSNVSKKTPKNDISSEKCPQVEITSENTPPNQNISNNIEPKNKSISEKEIFPAKSPNLPRELPVESQNFSKNISLRTTEIPGIVDTPNKDVSISKRSKSFIDDSLSDISRASFSSDSIINDSFNKEFQGQNKNKSATQPEISSKNKKHSLVTSSLNFNSQFPPNSENFQSFHFLQGLQSQAFNDVSDSQFHPNPHPPHLNFQSLSEPLQDDNFERNSFSESMRTNEKLTEIINTLTNKVTSLSKENLELKKQLNSQNNVKSLENTIGLQNDKIQQLEYENLKMVLELEEAGTILNDLINKFENREENFKITESLYNEAKSSIVIDENKMYTYPPKEVYGLYQKQKALFQKQSTDINTLLGEKESYKKSISDLKKENEELRTKISNLTDEDINKGILSFAIEENNKLKRKLELQREKNINLAFEHRAEMKKLEKLENENKILRKKVKIGKNKDEITKLTNWADEFPEEGWETTSESEILLGDPSVSMENNSKLSVVEVNKSSSSQNISKVTEKTNEPKNPVSKENVNFDKDENTGVSRVNSESRPKSSDKRGSPNNNAHISKKKRTCKFYLQNRCKFGDRCFNFHPIASNKPRNYVPSNFEKTRQYVPPYEKMKYTPNRAILFKTNELDFLNQIQLQNRFQPLPLLNLDSAENIGYWSVGQNPQLNNSSNHHIPNFQANNTHFAYGYHD